MVEKMEIKLHPIGKVMTPFKSPDGMPIQSSAAQGIRGRVILFPEYTEGIRDLDGFSHIILLYYFHLIQQSKLVVKPFLDDQLRGVYATRSPQRPNHIGLSVVRLLKIEGNTLHIENLDILDGTPLLDIKPYVSQFDGHLETSAGWLENLDVNLGDIKSDNRFISS